MRKMASGAACLRAEKRAVSDDFGRELLPAHQGVGAKDRQRGHSPEARSEKRAMQSEAPVGRDWLEDRTRSLRKNALLYPKRPRTA